MWAYRTKPGQDKLELGTRRERGLCVDVYGDDALSDAWMIQL